jgi:tetratricopeptide (TPR) repeat protein
VAIKPNYAWAFSNRGTAYANLGQFDMALADYSRALEINPDEASDYLNRGLTYQSLGREAQARADLEKARQLDPSLFPSP